MVQEQKTLAINPLEWCEACAIMLKRAMFSDPLAGVEALRLMVENSTAQLFGVFHGFYMVGCYVLRIDNKPGGNEAVIVAAAGRLKGTSLINSILPHVEKQFSGCAAIRVHTARPGMVRELKKYNYRVREIVLSKGL